MKSVPILESCECGNEPLVSIKAENLQTEWKTSNLNHGATHSRWLFDHFLFWRTSSRRRQQLLLSLLLIVLLHHNGGKLPQLRHSISISICFWQLPGRLLVNIKVHLMFIGPCIILIVELRETNLMPLVLLLLYSVLNMFRMLIHPSSGACD